MRNSSPIIVAIDTTDLGQAIGIAQATFDRVACIKLGLEFWSARGIEGVREVLKQVPGVDLFLDLKLHDIPNTVRGAATALRELQPRFLTVHASGGAAMIEAAVQSLPETAITAVTVLTSLDQGEVGRIGIELPIETWTEKLAAHSIAAGARAIVSSPWEIATLRESLGKEITLITPGVRPNDSKNLSDDQKRVMTPAQALQAGANYLVIGRPITQSSNPRNALLSILADIEHDH